MMSRQSYRRLTREVSKLQIAVEKKALAFVKNERVPLWIRRIKLKQLQKKGWLLTTEL